MPTLSKEDLLNVKLHAARLERDQQTIVSCETAVELAQLGLVHAREQYNRTRVQIAELMSEYALTYGVKNAKINFETGELTEQDDDQTKTEEAAETGALSLLGASD